MAKKVKAAGVGLIESVGNQRFGTILIDPPWRFLNQTGKVAPEHKRLSRYRTMSLDEIKALPLLDVAAPVCHLYLCAPKRFAPRGAFSNAELGVSVQVEHRLAQD